MKIVSWNVNGLRSVYKKGFLDFLGVENPDIVCLQEIKAQEFQLPYDLLAINGYQCYFCMAKKKGYSGVGVYSKVSPKKVSKKFGFRRFDSEGRFLELEYSGFILVNLYIPHGGRQKEKLNYKLEVYKRLFKKLDKVKNKDILLVGDFNIAHKEIDLARPMQNRNNIMFSSQERRQVDKLVEMGFVDSFREFNKQGAKYTWWPYAFNARERNMGWRIDYIFASKSFSSNLKRAFILPKVNGSDHCPIGIEINPQGLNQPFKF